MKKTVIFGNSGSGKTTFAEKLQRESRLPVLDLDTIAWKPGELGVRKDNGESEKLLDEFMDANDGWIVEGGYGGLIERAAECCTEMVFLNPGVEKCLKNNSNRPWEPHKYESAERQNEMLDFLQSWVKDYYSRRDEYSYERHRMIFDSFCGAKLEII